MKWGYFFLIFFCTTISCLYAQDNQQDAKAAETGQKIPEPGGVVPVPLEGNAMKNHGLVTGPVTGAPKLPEDLQDPFQGKEVAVPNTPEVLESGPEVAALLQGIGVGAEESFVILNEEVYYTGEEKNGIKLLEVRRGEADILVGGTPRTVRLLDEQEIKKATKRQLKKKANENKPLEAH